MTHYTDSHEKCVGILDSSNSICILRMLYIISYLHSIKVLLIIKFTIFFKYNAYGAISYLIKWNLISEESVFVHIFKVNILSFITNFSITI